MTILPLDQPGRIREGEGLPVDRLSTWIRARLPNQGQDLAIAQFPQGHSNLTYQVSVGGAEYVLRRPPFGNTVKTAHDMSREFRVLTALAPVFRPAPAPVLYCDDETVLGAPFYLMERRSGIVLRRKAPHLPALTPSVAERLCASFLDTLVELHAVDYRAIGLEGLGRPEGYVARQVSGWRERYEAAKTEVIPDLEAVGSWLAGQVPAERSATVVHNDFKFDNLLLNPADPGQVVAVLDWEMATIGDPLLDLGVALAYWIEAKDPTDLRSVAMGPTDAPGMWSRRRIAEQYAERSGRPVKDIGYGYGFGLFKVAVIVQQIYARYVRGHTRDPRFAGMSQVVAILARQAARAAERGTLPISEN